MRSPGHLQWPEYRLRAQAVNGCVTAEILGCRIAASEHAVQVDEDDLGRRFFFPRDDVDMRYLERSATMIECPFKGSAHFYSVCIGGRVLADVASTYEEPYDEHRWLRDRVVFDPQCIDIHVPAQGFWACIATAALRRRRALVSAR